VVHSRAIRSWVYTPFNRGINVMEGNKTVENHHFFKENPVNMAMFNSYVELPVGYMAN